MDIARVESSYNINAMHHNSNNTIDYGLMQINTINLPALAKYGINQSNIMDPAHNIEASAILLSQHMKEYRGNTYAAVGAYHSKNPLLGNPYADKVLN